MAGWNIPILNRKYILKGSMFHCYVSLPEAFFSSFDASLHLTHVFVFFFWGDLLLFGQGLEKTFNIRNGDLSSGDASNSGKDQKISKITLP